MFSRYWVCFSFTQPLDNLADAVNATHDQSGMSDHVFDDLGVAGSDLNALEGGFVGRNSFPDRFYIERPSLEHSKTSKKGDFSYSPLRRP
jgi:hypothetical protein